MLSLKKKSMQDSEDKPCRCCRSVQVTVLGGIVVENLMDGEEAALQREFCGPTVGNKSRSTVLTHGGEWVPRDGVRPSAEFSLM